MQRLYNAIILYMVCFLLFTRDGTPFSLTAPSFALPSRLNIVSLLISFGTYQDVTIRSGVFLMPRDVVGCGRLGHMADGFECEICVVV